VAAELTGILVVSKAGVPIEITELKIAPTQSYASRLQTGGDACACRFNAVWLDVGIARRSWPRRYCRAWPIASSHGERQSSIIVSCSTGQSVEASPNQNVKRRGRGNAPEENEFMAGIHALDRAYRQRLSGSWRRTRGRAFELVPYADRVAAESTYDASSSVRPAQP